MPYVVFDQYHHSSPELVSVCAVGCVTGNGESCSGREFCFTDGCYIYVVDVEEQGELRFLVLHGVSVPGYNTKVVTYL